MSAETQNITDSIKNFFNRPSSWYVEMAGFLIAGFIVGFLAKYGGRLFFLLLLGAAIALWALDYFNIITIHYLTLKSALGVSADTSFQEVISQCFQWIQNHIAESLAAVFGFILAWKLA